MGKFFDILFSMAEASARSRWEMFSRMYPSLLGPVAEEKISINTSRSSKQVKSVNGPTNLEPHAYHLHD